MTVFSVPGTVISRPEARKGLALSFSQLVVLDKRCLPHVFASLILIVLAVERFPSEDMNRIGGLSGDLPVAFLGESGVAPVDSVCGPEHEVIDGADQTGRRVFCWAGLDGDLPGDGPQDPAAAAGTGQVESHGV